MPKNLELFLTFARISASCFGGGYAMLPFFQRELVLKKKWLTDEQLLDLTGQVADASPSSSLRQTARATIAALRRGVVAYSSLSD